MTAPEWSQNWDVPEGNPNPRMMAKPVSKPKYRGRRGRHARKRCPHSNLWGIYGDQINMVGGWRLFCEDCQRYLNGPVSLVKSREHEQETG